MREILFRGKRKDTGTWVESRTLITLKNLDKGTLEYYLPPSDTPVFDMAKGFHKLMAIAGYMYEIDPATLGQYTGLTDKNGKKIFDGDIVKTGYLGSAYYARIEFDHDGFWVVNTDIQIPSRLGDCSKQITEVIGNIYDNPELLENKDVT